MALIGAEGITKHADASNEQLVDRVLSGEQALFEVLVRRHNQRLFRITRSILKDDAEAEDAMQEAYVKAFTKLGQFEGRASFSTWLTRIAVHEALRRARRQGRMTDFEENNGKHEQGSTQLSGERRNPEDAAGIAELSAVLEQVLDELPDNQRVVVMMRDVEGFSTAETAACLEISDEAVKVRLHRARAQLRGSIDERLTEATRNTFLFLVPRCDRMVGRVFAALQLVVPAA